MDKALACLGLFLSILICSCASKPVDPKDLPAESQNDVAATRWSYAENGLVMELASTDTLNLFEGAPHTLLLCVYELSGREGFEALAQTRSGIDKLLECTNFDPSVVMSRRRIAHPGATESVVMDRHENARYLGIVGGFYNLTPARATMLKAIPLVEEHDGVLWWSKRSFQPAVLNMRLELGADGFRPLPAQEK